MMTEMQYREILEEKERPEKEFLALFEKYKKNREMVSEEELKTRYKKSYYKLRQELAQKAAMFMKEYAIPNVRVTNNELNTPFMEEICAIIDEKSKDLSRAIFKDMDLDEVYEILNAVSARIYNIWWENSGSKQEGIFQKIR